MIEFFDGVAKLIKNQKVIFSIRELAILGYAGKQAKPELRQSKVIAETLGLSGPVVSRAIGNLQDLGLISAKALPRDARTLAISLTADGRKLFKSLGGVTPEKPVKAAELKEAA